MADDPITGICILADKNRCPEGYQVIETTTDNQDADLWKDKVLRKKVTRYLCYTKKINPLAGNNVLIDVMVIKENEAFPAGYSCLGTTYDSGEAVLKKKLLVIKLFNRNSTQQAVSEIFLTSGKIKTKPVEVSPRGDINGINLFLRMSTLKPLTPVTPETAPALRQAPIPAPRQNLPQPPASSGLPQQSSTSQLPYSWDNARTRRQSTLRTSHSLSSEHDVLSAIEGVPFRISSVLQSMTNMSNFDVPPITYKSAIDINSQFSYDFNFEVQTKQRLTMCDS
ncbi:multivesicular body subunit 12B-like [Diadema antillarum]|uniref:multivesicular body subunit 12B-like n=1 Tax=Diadema antillarum TaxID=105358 RepID=UPI003A8BE5A7